MEVITLQRRSTINVPYKIVERFTTIYKLFRGAAYGSDGCYFGSFWLPHRRNSEIPFVTVHTTLNFL